MSDAPIPNEHDASPEGPIKTPKQLAVAVVLAFIVPIVVIFLLASFVTSTTRPAAGSDALSDQETAERLRPIGIVTVRDSTDTASLKTGEQVFTAQCAVCHTAGVAGAPKNGDSTAWTARIATGYDALLHSALKGKGAMPPQGGGDFSDVEIGRAVVYMANQSGAKFSEPAAAATAAASAPAASDQAAVDAAAAQAASALAAATASVAPAAASSGGAAVAVPALYTQTCQVCHGTGVAGAPKIGDKATWAPRVALGIDHLTELAIKGIGAMPPRGGSSASDAEIREVVEYMVSTVK